MDERDEDRGRGEPFRSERGYTRETRGFAARAGDEIRSWVGDEEAERRRWMDEAERRREREAERLYRRDYGPYDYGWGSERAWAARGYGYPGERGWRGERWESPDRWRGDYDARRYGYGGETGRDTSWSGPSSGTYGQHGSPYVPWFGTRWDRGEWEREGPFVGRGPKGYQRSDTRIREDVCDRLTDAPDIDASDVEVTVNNGDVTLSGVVRNREEKRRSEDLVENIAGVRDVHNHLRVSRSQESTNVGP
jgi:osmotically-inducible protein OsmY